MTAAFVEKWLEGLGYADEPELLHRRGDTIPPRHPYALEIHTLLKHDGSVRARAVFDVEGVPTIVVLDGDIQGSAAEPALDDARKRIWNQNLATIVIHVREMRLSPFLLESSKRPSIVCASRKYGGTGHFRLRT